MVQLPRRPPFILDVQTLLNILGDGPCGRVVRVDGIGDTITIDRQHSGRGEVEHFVPGVIELISGLDVVRGHEIVRAALQDYASVRQIAVGGQDPQQRVGDLIKPRNHPFLAFFRPRLVIVDPIQTPRNVEHHPRRARRRPLHLMQLRVLRVRRRRTGLDEHRRAGAMAVLLVLENVEPRQLALRAHLPRQFAGEVPQHIVVRHR